jgi:hypothetical protein
MLKVRQIDFPCKLPPSNCPALKVVMSVCMASYMTTDYGHANHAFRVNVRS